VVYKSARGRVSLIGQSVADRSRRANDSFPDIAVTRQGSAYEVKAIEVAHEIIMSRAKITMP